MKKTAVLSIIIALMSVSCASLRQSAIDSRISKGRALWNELKYAEAELEWNKIPDENIRAVYAAAVKEYPVLLADAALSANFTDKDKVQENWDTAASLETRMRTFHNDLKNEPFTQRLAELDAVFIDLTRAVYLKTLAERGIGDTLTFLEKAKAVVAVGSAAGSSAASAGSATSAPSAGGAGTASDAIDAMIQELSDKKTQKTQQTGRIQQMSEDIEVLMQKAAASTSFTEKMEIYQTCLEKAASARKLCKDVLASFGFDEQISKTSSDLQIKSDDIQIEKDNLVRKTASSYSRVLGEVFSRLPNQSDLKKMTKEELMSVYDAKKKEIQNTLKKMEDMGREYPGLVDRGKIKKFTEETAVFASRVNNILSVMAQEEKLRAERGNTVFPLIIGLFNPSAGDSTKSKPAVVTGKTANAQPDWWWGKAEVNEESLFKIVVEVNDARTVRAFPETYKNKSVDVSKNVISGRNQRYNQWVIEDAGFKLENEGEYYLQMAPLKSDDSSYKAEIVTYEQIVTR